MKPKKRQKAHEYYRYIKRELICDVINYCVCSCNMDSRSVPDKIVIKNLTKEKKDGNKRHFDMNFHLRDGLRVKFTAYEVEDIIFVICRILQFCVSQTITDVRN